MCWLAVVPPGATNLYIHPKDAVIVEATKLTVLAVAALPSELPPAKLKKVDAGCDPLFKTVHAQVLLQP